MRTSIQEYRIIIDRTPRACEPTALGSKLHKSAEVAALAKTLIEDDEREHFLVLFLNGRNHLKGFSEISTGSLSACLVHPREAFRAAVGIGASAVIFVHNHPSGDPSPSGEDFSLTQRLQDAGRVLGIRVLDHIIIGDGTDQFYSYADEGGIALT